MQVETRIKGFCTLSLPLAVISGLIALAPLTASSAAAPDRGATWIEPATDAAVSALIPVTPAAGNAAPAPVLQPVETTLGHGSASYYATKFHGRRTASGEAFDNRALTAAHRTLPFGSMVLVTNPANGARVVVRINDRGPYARGRMIDVSRAAAEQLGLIARGHAPVELALVAG